MSVDIDRVPASRIDDICTCGHAIRYHNSPAKVALSAKSGVELKEGACRICVCGKFEYKETLYINFTKP